MSKFKHGKSRTKLYLVWNHIMQRCYNQNSKVYEHYGGRGITMQENWVNNFLAFESYVVSLPKYNADNLGRQGLSIDRIDNDSNYCEGNLRWTTAIMQGRNRRKQKNNKSGFVGVCFVNKSKKYVARITVNNKRVHLGYGATAKEAYQLRLDYIKENNLKNFEI